MRRIVKLPVFYLCLVPGAVLILYLGDGHDIPAARRHNGGSKLPITKTDIRLKDYEGGGETSVIKPGRKTRAKNSPVFLKSDQDIPGNTPDTIITHHTPGHSTPKDTSGGVSDSPSDVTAPPDYSPPSSSSPSPQLALKGEEKGEEEGKKEGLKTILVWNNGYGAKTMEFGEGRQPFVDHGCEVDACYLTSDRSHLPVTEYDAIIFHLRPTTPENLPPLRSPKQRWIMWEIESASYVYQDLASYAGLFNWTMTYRLDSDIPYRYGRVSLNKTLSSSSSSSSSPPRNYAKGKTKMAAWFVSNCLSHSRREKIVQFMKDVSMQVDVYGKCGKLKCSKEKEEECYGLLDKHYKFYLSFENSLCQDYVTEKLFSILRHDVVPVVFGLANYTAVAPPHSFINVLDFSSVKTLVDYLRYLDTNDEAYNKYFKWKGHYQMHDSWHTSKEAFCALCKKLHEDSTPKVYKDIKKWFVSQGGCKRVHGMPLHSLRSFDSLKQKFEILIKDQSFESFLYV